MAGQFERKHRPASEHALVLAHIEEQHFGRPICFQSIVYEVSQQARLGAIKGAHTAPLRGSAALGCSAEEAGRLEGWMGTRVGV